MLAQPRQRRAFIAANRQHFQTVHRREAEKRALAQRLIQLDPQAVEIVNDLRDLGIRAEADHMGRSLKAQMKYANKLAVTYTTALGSDELENGKITVKRMGDGTKMECSLNAGAIAELSTKQEQ